MCSIASMYPMRFKVFCVSYVLYVCPKPALFYVVYLTNALYCS